MYTKEKNAVEQLTELKTRVNDHAVYLRDLYKTERDKPLDGFARAYLRGAITTLDIVKAWLDDVRERKENINDRNPTLS